MGGFGSGRHGGRRTTVESGLALDINRIVRQRSARSGHFAGLLTWSNVHTGEKTASIGYEALFVNSEAAWVQLYYTANGTPKDYRVWLEATRCHYGGLRWWWICPVSGRRAAKLYLPPGATMFAAREACSLAYRSQRQAAIDRTHARQARLYGRLGGTYDYFEQRAPPRPKGMHSKTYERLKAELYAAMEAHNEAFIAEASAILGRPPKA